MNKFNINNRRYLGSKYSLIDDLHESLDLKEINSVADIFGGTGVVGESFAKKGKQVILNDILYSNIVIYKCFFDKEKFDIKKIVRYIETYNNIKHEDLDENYFSLNFSDTYFSHSNCKKIGYIRENIKNELDKGHINKREYYILITSLLYAVDKIANTVGHYDAYRENKDDLIQTLELRIPNIQNYKNEINIHREDANKLVKDINVDLVYIDPPYNSRQYCDMYHLLENLAEWKKPKVYYKAKKMDRTHIKSEYSKKEATEAFRNLIDNINAKYIVVSYNNTGKKGASRSSAKINDDDLINILKQKGSLKIFDKDYSRYTTGKSNIENLSERFFICTVKSKKKITKVHKPKIDNNKYIKTPLNYTGGKYKLLDKLNKVFKEDLRDRTFIDLFTGGGNVGINVNAGKIICNDIQSNVIRLYKLFQGTDIDILLNNIESLIEYYNLSNSINNSYQFYGCNSSSGLGSYNKKFYGILKKDYNQMQCSIKKDYLFFLLIVFGFNNQIRFNLKNEFNMPVGKRDFNKNLKNNLINTVTRINQKNIEFISKDFREIDFNTYKNPFIYCDPPYILTTASYNENNGWTKKDELDLLDKLQKANNDGFEFVLSNVLEHSGNKHSLLLEWALQNKFNIIHLKNSYKNSSYQKKDKKTDSDEVLITNYF